MLWTAQIKTKNGKKRRIVRHTIDDLAIKLAKKRYSELILFSGSARIGGRMVFGTPKYWEDVLVERIKHYRQTKNGDNNGRPRSTERRRKIDELNKVIDRIRQQQKPKA